MFRTCNYLLEDVCCVRSVEPTFEKNRKRSYLSLTFHQKRQHHHTTIVNGNVKSKYAERMGQRTEKHVVQLNNIPHHREKIGDSEGREIEIAQKKRLQSQQIAELSLVALFFF